MSTNSSRRPGRIVGVVVTATLVALIGAGVYFAKSYYDQRYAGDTFYTRVPLSEPVALNDLYDATGQAVDKGYDYSLIGYNESGEERILEFGLRASSADDLYQPGTYLKVEASPTLVLYQEAVDESQVPVTIRHLLQ